MCGDLFRKWLVLVVCTCAVAAAAEPNEPVAEPNESWIVAEHLMADWESMALTTRLYSPWGPASPDKIPQRSLSFAGRIHVLDASGLIGLSELATNAKAFDELGDPIETTRVSQYPMRYMPLRYSTTIQLGTGNRIVSIVPYEFTIDMTMARGAPFPLVFSRLEWSMSALRSDDFEAIDIPFAPTVDWIELAPGLEILVEQAVVTGGKYDYRLKARYDPNRISYADARERSAGSMGRPSETPYFWLTNIHPLPEMIVTAVHILDVDDKILTQSGGTDYSDISGQRIVTRTGNARGAESGKAAFIRHVIAFKPYNQELQFLMENVPVPTE